MNNENLPPGNTPAEPPAGTPAPVAAAAAAPRAEDLPGWERATMEKLLFATLEEQKSARRWLSLIHI